MAIEELKFHGSPFPLGFVQNQAYAQNTRCDDVLRSGMDEASHCCKAWNSSCEVQATVALRTPVRV